MPDPNEFIDFESEALEDFINGADDGICKTCDGTGEYPEGHLCKDCGGRGFRSL
jgi:DnaJ-class molecular chaperone